MTQSSGFELSRAYAKGWMAGKNYPAPPAPEALETTLDGLNPFSEEDRRDRWAAGFTEALQAAATAPKLKGRPFKASVA
jgi:ribosome modulation factor